jgi:hypothetical protein
MGNFQHPSMLPSIPEAQMAFVVWSVILAGLSTEGFIIKIKKMKNKKASCINTGLFFN